MADSSQVEISYVAESTWGTTPNSALQALRHTGGTFGQATETVRSNEVRGDAQRGGSFRTDVSASPSLDIELSPTSFDDFIQACFRGTWTTPVNLSGTDIAATGTGFSSSSTNLTTNVTVGQWVYVGGFANTAINTWYKVTAVTSTSMTTTPVPAATASAGAAVTIKGSTIRNGQTERSFTLQKKHADLTNKFLVHKGARVGNFNLNIQPGQLITGNFGFEAKDTATATSSAGNGTVNAATTTSVMNAVDNVSRLMIGGTLITTSPYITQLSFGLNMNPRPQKAVGTLGPIGIAMGSADLTGTLEMYLDDTSWTQLSNYLAFTKTSLSLAVSLAGGVGYVIEFPNVAFTNEANRLNGNDTDELLSFNFAAEPGTIGSQTKTIQISRNS